MFWCILGAPLPSIPIDPNLVENSQVAESNQNFGTNSIFNYTSGYRLFYWPSVFQPRKDIIWVKQGLDKEDYFRRSCFAEFSVGSSPGQDYYLGPCFCQGSFFDALLLKIGRQGSCRQDNAFPVEISAMGGHWPMEAILTSMNKESKRQVAQCTANSKANYETSMWAMLGRVVLF